MADAKSRAFPAYTTATRRVQNETEYERPFLGVLAPCVVQTDGGRYAIAPGGSRNAWEHLMLGDTGTPARVFYRDAANRSLPALARLPRQIRQCASADSR